MEQHLIYNRNRLVHLHLCVTKHRCIKFNRWGAYQAGRYIQAHWSSSEDRKSIVWKELFAVTAAVNTWASLWVRKKSFSIMTIRLLWIYGRQGPLSYQMLGPWCDCYISVQLDMTIHVYHHLFWCINNAIKDALSRFQVNCFQQLAHMQHHCWTTSLHGQSGLLSQYQFLRVAASTHQTYQIRIRAFQQFCYQFSILSIPAPPFTLCASVAQNFETIKSIVS